jgi:hypothetical protein
LTGSYDKYLLIGFDHVQYDAETRVKYDDKNVEKNIQRTSGYSKGDWERMKLQEEAILDGITANMAKGPDDPEVSTLLPNTMSM